MAVLTPNTKRIPPELTPLLCQVYETLQQTSNGFITESLLTKLEVFLPFKVGFLSIIIILLHSHLFVIYPIYLRLSHFTSQRSTIKMHLKKSKQKNIVETMEQDLKRLEGLYLNNLRFPFFIVFYFYFISKKGSYCDHVRYDAEYNKLRAVVYQTVEAHNAQQAEKPTEESGEGKKYPWVISQKNMLFDTLSVGYQIVECKIQIAYVPSPYLLTYFN